MCIYTPPPLKNKEAQMVHVYMRSNCIAWIFPALDVGKEASFFVNTADAGNGDLEPTVTGPEGEIVPVKVVPVENGFDVRFTPTEEGLHDLDMRYGGVAMLEKPISLSAIPKADASRVIAEGPGLSQGVVNKPADFAIDIRKAGRGGLGVTIEGPSEAEIDCQDNGDGTCAVHYTPNEPGKYNINILFDGEHIKDSPFEAKVVDPSKVTATGPGLENGAFADLPCTFDVDCSEAGPAFDDYDDEDDLPLKCMALGPNNEIFKTDVKPIDENIYQVKYYPENAGPVNLDAIFCGENIPEFPKTVEVQERLIWTRLCWLDLD